MSTTTTTTTTTTRDRGDRYDPIEWAQQWIKDSGLLNLKKNSDQQSIISKSLYHTQSRTQYKHITNEKNMKGLVGGPLLMGGLGPGPSAPLKSGPGRWWTAGERGRSTVSLTKTPSTPATLSKQHATYSSTLTTLKRRAAVASSTLLRHYKKHLKNVGPIRHCEPPHVPFTRCRY